jgi:Putative peptidoglycan binding domain
MHHKTACRIMLAAPLALGLLAPGKAGATDALGSFAVHGMGAQTCEILTKTAAQESSLTRAALSSWMMGYLTAFNRLQADTFDASPVTAGASLAEMVLSLCGNNQAATVEAVAFSLLRQLSPARQTKDSPILQVRAGNVATAIRKEVLIKLQTELVKLKHYDGPANGDYNDKVKAALEAFQKAQNLSPTGLPDASTIVRMLVELPAREAQATPAQPATTTPPPTQRRQPAPR